MTQWPIGTSGRFSQLDIVVRVVILENKEIGLVPRFQLWMFIILSYSTGIDLLLISCLVGSFFGRFIRNIPLLFDLAVTSVERISVGMGIAQ
jgi:hypothetical protein